MLYQRYESQLQVCTKGSRRFSPRLWFKFSHLQSLQLSSWQSCRNCKFRFDETNGSQKEKLPLNLDEPPLDEVIRYMAIGDIRPVEGNAHQVNKDDDGPMFPHIARGARDQHPEANDVQVEGERINEE